MGHRKNGWRRERRRPFSRFELFLEKTEWVLVIEEEHFVCFPSSEPLSAVQRLILRALTRTCVSFCFLFFLFELVNLSEDEPTDEMLIPSGKPFCIFLFYFCRNTETLVQHGGDIFEGCIFFFNIVTIVEFCLKNLLSEKHWSKHVEVQLLKVSGILCVCASKGTSRVSAFLSSGAIIDKLVKHWVYIESQ